MVVLMNIKDKKILSKKRCCPPHYIPHKLPFGKKICDEPCHFHKARWRMWHHKWFCQVLGCVNYKWMIKKYETINK
jgi:hypothetical protein